MFGGLFIEGCLEMGVASGGNNVLCELSWRLLERTGGVSVVPLKLASVGAFVSENRLVMGRPRRLIGTEATGDEACERAGETLLEGAGDGAARDGTLDPCRGALRDSTGVSMSASRGSSSHIVLSCGISTEPSLSKGMSMTCCPSMCTRDEGEGWWLGLR